MKAQPFALILILAIGLAGCTGAEPAYTPAYGTNFTTRLIYQNPIMGTPAKIRIVYYPSADTKYPIYINTFPDLSGGKSSSIFIGSLNQTSAGFHGSIDIRSEPRLIYLQMQISETNRAVKVRPISNVPLTGTPSIYFPSVLRNFTYANTVFTIQNLDSHLNQMHLRLYDTEGTKVYSYIKDMEAGEVYTFDAGKQQDNPLPEKFNGSAIVTATQSDLITPGKLVGNALELDSVHLGAKSFEGVGHGSLEIFMPSAACDFDIGGKVLLNTTYAVQNTNENSPTEVIVTYSNGKTQTQLIKPGGKASFVACQAGNMSRGFLGAAVIKSNGGQVVAIGKAYGGGLSTAFIGTASDAGQQRLALPYVRWANDENWMNGTQPRTFITIQNIGTEPITDTIKVYYISCNGYEATDPISFENGALMPGENVKSNPGKTELKEFGACGEGPQVSGSAIVEGPKNSRLAAVVRVQQWDKDHEIVVGDDYNGFNMP